MISVISLLAKSFALRSPSGNVAPKLQGSLPSRIPREFELPGEDAIIRKEGVRLIIEETIQQNYLFSMRNHHLLILVLAGAMLWSAENWAKAADPTAKEGQLIHTPKPGSPERQAICDGARPYVVSNYTTAPLPQPIVFKISHLSVQEPYCNLEAIPLFKDGSYMSTEYMADIAFNFCMKETAGTWKVIVDLSRTDVPSTSELRKIRGNFPEDFPLSLLSPSWRQWLQ
jgi:hypothetical protein